MRGVSVVAAILMLALSGSALQAEAISTLDVSISGPTVLGAMNLAEIHGNVRLGPARAPQVSVTILVDGNALATVVTDANGRYTHSFMTPNVNTNTTLTLQARADLAGVASGVSPPHALRVVPRPSAPQNLAATTNAVDSTAFLTWSPPLETHGLQVTSYVVNRALGGNVVGMTVNGTTLWLNDSGPVWNTTYRYYVYAVTFAGAGRISDVIEVTFPPPPPGALTVHVPYATVCHAFCGTVEPGTYDVRGENLSVQVFAAGWLTATDGLGIGGARVQTVVDGTTPCSACSPTSFTATMNATTFSSGAYVKQVPAVWRWSDLALGECRDLDLALVSTHASLSANGAASYTFCRTS